MFALKVLDVFTQVRCSSEVFSDNFRNKNGIQKQPGIVCLKVTCAFLVSWGVIFGVLVLGHPVT